MKVQPRFRGSYDSCRRYSIQVTSHITVSVSLSHATPVCSPPRHVASLLQHVVQLRRVVQPKTPRHADETTPARRRQYGSLAQSWKQPTDSDGFTRQKTRRRHLFHLSTETDSRRKVLSAAVLRMPRQKSPATCATYAVSRHVYYVYKDINETSEERRLML